MFELHPVQSTAAVSWAGQVDTSNEEVTQRSKWIQRRNQQCIGRSECDEPRVVRGFSQDRQGHSRDHVEEGCE